MIGWLLRLVFDFGPRTGPLLSALEDNRHLLERMLEVLNQIDSRLRTLERNDEARAEAEREKREKAWQKKRRLRDLESFDPERRKRALAYYKSRAR